MLIGLPPRAPPPLAGGSLLAALLGRYRVSNMGSPLVLLASRASGCTPGRPAFARFSDVFLSASGRHPLGGFLLGRIIRKRRPFFSSRSFCFPFPSLSRCVCFPVRGVFVFPRHVTVGVGNHPRVFLFLDRSHTAPEHGWRATSLSPNVFLGTTVFVHSVGSCPPVLVPGFCIVPCLHGSWLGACGTFVFDYVRQHRLSVFARLFLQPSSRRLVDIPGQPSRAFLTSRLLTVCFVAAVHRRQLPSLQGPETHTFPFRHVSAS